MLEYTGWDTMAVLNQRQEKIERDRQRAAADKALRDHFAAAALAGLLARNHAFGQRDHCFAAYRWADAMLRERGNHSETPNSSPNLDAAPAARASVESVAPQPTAGDRAGNLPSHSGTGDAQEIAAYRRFVSEVMNWISEATGFLHDDVLRTDDARDLIHNACMRCWDAFDRIAYPTVHGASPEARASVESVAPQPTTRGDSDRTDKAAPRPSEGTGDTPKPISGCVSDRSKPIASEQEPVAWAVMPSNSDYCVTLSTRKEAAKKAAERKVEVGEYATMDDIVIVPLYRHPPCQDVSQKNLTLTAQERPKEE